MGNDGKLLPMMETIKHGKLWKMMGNDGTWWEMMENDGNNQNQSNIKSRTPLDVSGFHGFHKAQGHRHSLHSPCLWPYISPSPATATVLKNAEKLLVHRDVSSIPGAKEFLGDFLITDLENPWKFLENWNLCPWHLEFLTIFDPVFGSVYMVPKPRRRASACPRRCPRPGCTVPSRCQSLVMVSHKYLSSNFLGHWAYSISHSSMLSSLDAPQHHPLAAYRNPRPYGHTPSSLVTFFEVASKTLFGGENILETHIAGTGMHFCWCGSIETTPSCSTIVVW